MTCLRTVQVQIVQSYHQTAAGAASKFHGQLLIGNGASVTATAGGDSVTLRDRITSIVGTGIVCISVKLTRPIRILIAGGLSLPLILCELGGTGVAASERPPPTAKLSRSDMEVAPNGVSDTIGAATNIWQEVLLEVISKEENAGKRTAVVQILGLSNEPLGQLSLASGVPTWTPRLRQPFKLWVRDASSGLRLVSIVEAPAEAQGENIVPPLELVPAASVSEQNAAEDVSRVAILELVEAFGVGQADGDAREIYHCTAVQISPSLVMTNHHCLPTNMLQDWRHTELPQDGRRPSAFFTVPTSKGGRRGFFKLQSVEAANVDLDVALIKLEETRDIAEINLFVQSPAIALATDMPVKIIEYWADRGELVINMDDQCQVVAGYIGQAKVQAFEFFHRCDTNPQSSGSPIFVRGTGMLAGLHRVGFTQAHGQRNRGIHIHAVRSWICDSESSGLCKALGGTPPG